MGMCNRCRLNNLKWQARKDGMDVTLICDNGGGAQAYVHPPGIAHFQIQFFPERYQQYKRDGYMLLPDYCTCDD